MLGLVGDMLGFDVGPFDWDAPYLVDCNAPGLNVGPFDGDVLGLEVASFDGGVLGFWSVGALNGHCGRRRAGPRLRPV